MILESLFYGNFAPMELVYLTDPTGRKCNQRACQLMEELKEELTPEGQSILDEMLREIYTAQLIECEAYFSFALAAGMQLQTELQAQFRKMREEEI